jgi:hypothetical protein
MDGTLQHHLFGDGPLGLFMQEKADKELGDDLVKKLDDDDEIVEIMTAYETVAFETGFALGQMFDLEDPEAKGYIEKLIQEMREKKAIRLFPNRKEVTFNRPMAKGESYERKEA